MKEENSCTILASFYSDLKRVLPISLLYIKIFLHYTVKFYWINSCLEKDKINVNSIHC